MNDSLAPFALAALASLALTAGLAAVAPRLGWLDAPTLARKTQPRAVPPVGGAAILFGFGLAAALFGWRAPLGLSSAHALVALGLVFLVGSADDRLPHGLSPLAKLGGQLASALPLALASAERFADAPLAAFALALLAVVAALNLANTFDHADGALGSLALLCSGLAASPALAGAVAGFLPLNLNAKRVTGEEREATERTSVLPAALRSSSARAGAPSAYLGDAGSHVLGLLLLLTPLAWPAFLLPALDLARLSIARLRAGSRPWIGDRRHVAHLLAAGGRAAGGRSPRRVAAWLVLAAAPSAACVALDPAAAPGRVGVVLVLGAAGYAGLLLLARAGAGRTGPGSALPAGNAARPCPLPPSAE